MKKTKHATIEAGQSIFQATAYSDNDVFQLGSDEVNLSNFRNNPVLLAEHDSHHPVGQITKLGWQKKGLRCEFVFDEASEEGTESMRKWMKGLKSSLSIGLAGRYNRTQDRMSWMLREISQVSVPLDPKATATPSERSPMRVASYDQFKTVEQEIKEAAEGTERLIYLTASIASENERMPLAVQGGADPDEQEGSDEGSEDQNKTAKNQNSKQMETNEQHMENLQALVTELKASRDSAKEEVKTLKAANKTLTDEVEDLKAKLKEQKDRIANTSEEHLFTLSEELNEKKASLDTKEAELDTKEGELKVKEAAVTFKDFLPAGFEIEGLSVMDVLQAAAPKNMPTAGMSEEALHGMLMAEKTRRLETRLRGSASDDGLNGLDDSAPHTYPAEEIGSGMISATELLLDEN